MIHVLYFTLFNGLTQENLSEIIGFKSILYHFMCLRQNCQKTQSRSCFDFQIFSFLVWPVDMYDSRKTGFFCNENSYFSVVTTHSETNHQKITWRLAKSRNRFLCPILMVLQKQGEKAPRVRTHKSKFIDL